MGIEVAILIDPNPEPKDRIFRSPRRGRRPATVSQLKVTDLSCHIFNTRIDNPVVDARASNGEVVAENQRRVFDSSQIPYPVDASSSCTSSLQLQSAFLSNSNRIRIRLSPIVGFPMGFPADGWVPLTSKLDWV